MSFLIMGLIGYSCIISSLPLHLWGGVGVCVCARARSCVQVLWHTESSHQPLNTFHINKLSSFFWDKWIKFSTLLWFPQPIHLLSLLFNDLGARMHMISNSKLLDSASLSDRFDLCVISVLVFCFPLSCNVVIDNVICHSFCGEICLLSNLEFYILGSL